MPPDAMAAARDTTIPASNLAMLMMLANKDPATLRAMGATPQVCSVWLKSYDGSRSVAVYVNACMDVNTWQAVGCFG
jgi:hypothetical protein